MDDDQSMEEIRCDLDQPRIAPYKNTWRPRQNMVYWCKLMLAQKRGLQFYQTRSHAIVLYNTLPAICIEKAVCMKSELSGSCTTIGSRNKSWNSWRSSSWTETVVIFLVQRCLFFSLAGKWIPLQLVQTLSTETPAARHTFTCTVTPQVTQHRWHVYICSRRVVRRKTSHHPRVMSLPLLHATLSTFSPSLSSASCVVVFFLSEPRPVVHVSNYPLRRSTAGWHCYGRPLLHRSWAQRDRTQQDAGQTTKSNNWRPGWYWRNWCQKVVLQPIIGTLSLRFGRKHCDAARLGPRGRAIT